MANHGGVTKTELLQRRIFMVDQAENEFSRPQTHGQVPLVLIPDSRYICSCCMTVPTGPNCVLHKWGAYQGLAQAGLQCKPAYYRVAYCVTRKACTYNAPIKSCPTADNVMVDCDLTLIFTIGSTEDDVKNFVYHLGARRFDEFLFAAVEEGIRHLIRSCSHREVYELRGQGDDRVARTLEELKKKFRRFGVLFESMVITDVRFKPELQQTLQRTTENQSLIEEQAKKQKYEMDKISFQQARELQELEKVNNRKIQDLKAYRDRCEIDRKRQQVKTQGESEVKMTEAQEAASIAITQHTGDQKVARAQGLKKRKQQLADSEAKDRAARIQADQEASITKFEAEQRLMVSKNKADTIIAQSQAEQKAASSLKIRREHELRMAKLEVLQVMAMNANISISGEQGDKLINEMLSSDILAKITVSGGGGH